MKAIILSFISLSLFAQVNDVRINEQIASVDYNDSVIIESYHDSARVETDLNLTVYEIADYPHADTLPLNAWVERGECYSYKGDNYIVVQSHVTAAHWMPDVDGILGVLYKQKQIETGCNAEEWNASQNWTTYSLGDLRTNQGKLYKVINVGYTYYEPSSQYGHYGWEYVDDCE